MEAALFIAVFAAVALNIWLMWRRGEITGVVRHHNEKERIKSDQPWIKVKIGVARAGGLGLLVAGLWLAWFVRNHQVSGQPMPNGKGGFMSYGYGYLMDLILFLMSIAWWLSACRLRRESKPKMDGH